MVVTIPTLIASNEYLQSNAAELSTPYKRTVIKQQLIFYFK